MLNFFRNFPKRFFQEGGSEPVSDPTPHEVAALRRPCLASGILLLGLVLLTGCPGPRPSAEPLAQVGSVVLTPEELTAELLRRQKLSRTPVSASSVVEDWVRHQLLLSRARELGFDHDPELQRRWERLLVARVEAELEEQQRQLRAPQPEEIQAHYKTHPDEYVVPEQIRIAQLVLKVPPGASPEQRAALRRQAEQFRSAVRDLPASDLTWGDLARQFSEDRVTRFTGGDCGWQDRKAVAALGTEAVQTAVWSLQTPGEVSPIVETEHQLQLFRLVARKPSAPRPLEEVREQILHRLQRQRHAEVAADFDRSLRAGVVVRIHSSAVASWPSATPSLAKQSPPPALPAP